MQPFFVNVRFFCERSVKVAQIIQFLNVLLDLQCECSPFMAMLLPFITLKWCLVGNMRVKCC